MPEDRPAIPADVKRRVLVEAGHRCAIPTCRYITTELHHIVPWEQCQKHEYENLIALCPNCHKRADEGEIDRKSLLMYKANLRFAHDKFSNFEIDLLFDLYSRPQNYKMPFPGYLILLAKRLLDAGYIQWSQSTGGMFVGQGNLGTEIDFAKGLRLSPDHLSITADGISFIKSLADIEINK